MRHPRFIHFWRDFWNPRQSYWDHDARRRYKDEPWRAKKQIAENEAERQANMPSYTQTYIEVIGTGLAVGGGLSFFLWYLLD